MCLAAFGVAILSFTRAEGGEPTATPGCTMHLTGAMTMSLACSARVTWNEAKGLASVSLVAHKAAPLDIVNATVARKGAPALGTWKSDDRGADGAVVVAKHGTPLPSWLASSATSGIPPQGSYTLYLSTLGPPDDASYGKSYLGHGTLEATLAAQPKTGASGQIHLRAQF